MRLQETRFIKLTQLPFDHLTNTNILDTTRNPRLDFASRRRRPITRNRYLVQNGADPCISNPCGWSVLFDALKKMYIRRFYKETPSQYRARTQTKLL